MAGRQDMKVAIRFSIAAGVAAVLGTAGAAPASAAGWSCEASAVRAAVLGTPIAEPVAANKGQALCRAAKVAGSSGLPAALAVNTLAAETGATGPAETPGAQ